jgi:serine/threonine protein kinase
MNQNETLLIREECVKGTQTYSPPEIYDERYENTDISKRDLWSIGVIAYELCTLRVPFSSRHAIIENPHDPIQDELYSDELIDVINSLLDKNPEQRPSI